MQSKVDVIGPTSLNNCSRLWGLRADPGCLDCFKMGETDIVCVSWIKEGLGIWTWDWLEGL